MGVELSFPREAVRMTEPDSKQSDAQEEPALEEPEQAVAVEAQPVTDPSSETPAESATETGLETASEAPTETETEAASGTEAVTEAEAETETATEAEAEAATEAEAASETEGEASEEGKKKKRRRRRKKKPAPDDADSAHKTPFAGLFSGGRKHAFSVGEIIAGRVERVADGTIVVDLFGKATAVVDANEPRDAPVVVAEPEAFTVAETATVTETAAETGTETEAAAEAETAPATETVAAAETGAAAATGAVTETGTVAATEADAETEAEAAIETVAETAPETEAEAASETEADAETEAEAAPETEADAATEPGPEPEHAPITEVDEDAITLPGTIEAHPPPRPSPEPITEPGTVAAPQPEAEDLSDADLSLLEPLPPVDAPEVGGIFRGRVGAVSESGHIAIVNRIIDRAEAKKAIRAARAQRRRVEGIVFGYNRGGFDVLVAGIRAFCPASVMSLEPITDPKAFIGLKCEFGLPENKGGKGSKRSIIVSRRNILEKEARKRARERMQELKVGDKLPGKVIDVRDYGVLIDIGGGLDGLVHLSELSWKRALRPADVAKPGDEVEVEVVKLQPASRKDRFGRVSLSLRACQADPWDEIKDILHPGRALKGKVVRTTDFGAFIELREGIEGLLHISELGGKNITHASQALDEGQEIDVVIERVDKSQRRISLSKLSAADAKAIEAGEFDPAKAPRSLKPGSHVTVLVKRIEHGGAQVQVEGVLGKRGRGFITNREMSEASGDRRKGPSQGDLVEVKILGTDRDGALRCSVRARLIDEERQAVREYRKEASKQGLGTFGDLLRAKLGQTEDTANDS